MERRSASKQEIVARAAAKKAKNYAEADRIRKELLTAGITLEDGAQGHALAAGSLADCPARARDPWKRPSRARFGFTALILALAWLFSENRRVVAWRTCLPGWRCKSYLAAAAA